MNLEIYKDIPNFEGTYQISNLGNVKSLSRIILSNGKYPYKSKEMILKQTVSRGYSTVGLTKKNIKKTFFTHILVAIVFHKHIPCGHKMVVNHIDLDKLNNRANNLEIITQRENANQKHIKSSSNFTGVCWYKSRNKWIASIRVNGRNKHLGYFTNEIQASNAYQNKLKTLV